MTTKPDLLRKKLGVNFGNKVLFGLIILLVIITMFKFFYVVNTDEAAMVLRLGKWNGQYVDAGLHFKIPYVDTIFKAPIKKVLKEEFGFRTEKAGIQTKYSNANYDDESLTLTGDLNVADLEWIVQYQIKAPFKALFNIRDLEGTLRDLAEATVRQKIGSVPVDAILTTERTELGQKSRDYLQACCDKVDIGIKITTFRYQNAQPPQVVQKSYNKVNEAEQQRESLIFNARKTYNEQIPAARGQAEKQIRQAEGYATERINNAKGEADRFKSILAEYKKAKEVTRSRMYLETMKKVLPNAKEIYVVDGNQMNPLTHLSLRDTTDK